jgi:hypothetical protein
MLVAFRRLNWWSFVMTVSELQKCEFLPADQQVIRQRRASIADVQLTIQYNVDDASNSARYLSRILGAVDSEK